MDKRYIIIFDGVCNFCNGAVNFIIRRDPNKKFSFAPMQNDVAKNLIKEYKASGVGVDTFLLIKNQTCYYRSDAVLEIVKDLSGFWYLFRIFIFLPKKVRDFFYRAFARNRYEIFGKRKKCMVPTEEVKSRFIE